MVDGLLLLLVWIAMVAQRVAEMGLARRHAEALRRRGAIEYGAGHYPVMVLIHVGWFASWLVEGWKAGLSPWWKVWLCLALLGQGLRLACILSLGPRWTTRVLVLPGQPLVRSGPYRWLPHPNYLGVALELASFPLVFGAWRTALVFSLANAALLKVRIAVEDQALGRR